MLNLHKDEYNEVTYQIIQALLFKVTDNLLAIMCSAENNKLDVTAFYDAENISELDKELIAAFEAGTKERLPAYHTELTIKEVPADDFARESITLTQNLIFMRFSTVWW